MFEKKAIVFLQISAQWELNYLRFLGARFYEVLDYIYCGDHEKSQEKFLGFLLRYCLPFYFFKASLISASNSSAVGPAGAASGSGAFVLLYAFIIMNITKPTMIKLMMVLIQAP